MRPMRSPGVAKTLFLPSLGPPLLKVLLNSSSGQKNRTTPFLAERYCRTLFQMILRPRPTALVTGTNPPTFEERANLPMPLPAASVGVTTAQQLPLPFLPVGIEPARKVVTIALP